MKRHLIVKPCAIGDVILTIPAVAAFKEANGGEIWWICGEIAAPILRRYPFIDRIITISEKKLFNGTGVDRLEELFRIWRLLVGVHFDTYALLQYDVRYRVIGFPTTSRNKIFLKRGDRMREAIRGRSTTDEFARILLGLDGPITERLSPILLPGLPTKTDLTRRIGIVPGGAKNHIADSPLRRWPLDQYVSLAKLLLDHGFEVFLVGASSDRWALSEFKDLPVVEKLGSLSITQSVDLMADLDVVVTHDTGVLHMAALTATPIVALFGPTNPREVLPHRNDIICIWGGETLACRPCYDGQSLPSGCTGHLCMRAITPQSVFKEITRILDRAKSSLRGGLLDPVLRNQSLMQSTVPLRTQTFEDGPPT